MYFRHIREVHEKERKFSCPFCDYTATRKFLIKTHVQSVHEKKNDFKCELCSFKTSTKRYLKNFLGS